MGDACGWELSFMSLRIFGRVGDGGGFIWQYFGIGKGPRADAWVMGGRCGPRADAWGMGDRVGPRADAWAVGGGGWGCRGGGGGGGLDRQRDSSARDRIAMAT